MVIPFSECLPCLPWYDTYILYLQYPSRLPTLPHPTPRKMSEPLRQTPIFLPKCWEEFGSNLSQNQVNVYCDNELTLYTEELIALILL